VTAKEFLHIEQARQIIHVHDFCNECGNCATFCVHQGKPYQDKPRLFLEESDFQSEDDNAFYIEQHRGGWSIRRREGGKESRLAMTSGTDEITFENDWLRTSFSAHDFQVKTMELKQELEAEFSLVGAAEMYVILKGVSTSLPFLPFRQS